MEINLPETLYFENFCALEITTLCQSLEALVHEEITDYIFEPIDEKDFRLEVKKEGDFFRIYFFVAQPLVLGTYQWHSRAMIGFQMKASHENLATFSSELQKELDTLLVKMKLVVKN